MKVWAIGVSVIAVLIAGYLMWPAEVDMSSPSENTALATVVLPDELSDRAKMGKSAFEAKCTVCHGNNAVGQAGVAPPLIHKIYEPSHHGDEAFQRAVSMGVRAHHWPFGDMPPVTGLTRADVDMLVAYIREVQRANGIN
ncbi:c-type cytochrome [Tateyamaria sp.]|uniref:c-type cytochrome n=1 Tax=Tateyamaria sp. TaxID=1929288 RepID=UPI00329C42A0